MSDAEFTSASGDWVVGVAHVSLKKAWRLAEIVLIACAHNPKERYSSPLQMRGELEAILYELHEAQMIYPKGDEVPIKSIDYVEPPLPLEERNGQDKTADIFSEAAAQSMTEKTPSKADAPAIPNEPIGGNGVFSPQIRYEKTGGILREAAEETERIPGYAVQLGMADGRNMTWPVEKGGLLHQSKKNKKRVNLLLFIPIFIVAVISALTLLLALFTAKEGELPAEFFGNYLFPITTTSMQREIPQGSLVITEPSDPRELVVGDIITFVQSDMTFLTHKIFEILNDFDNSGQMAFLTKGTENVDPDKDVVLGADIIGRVVLVIPVAGEFIYFLAYNIHIPIAILVICLITLLYSTGVFSKLYGQAAKKLVKSENAK